MNSTRTLARVQAASGLVFAVFLTLHLVNTALAAFGPAPYDAAQRSLRRLYQGYLPETVLTVALALHIGAGVTRARRRRGHGRPATRRVRVHRWAGWFLALVIVGHVAATRGVDLLFGAAPGFEGVAYVTQRFPLFFVPYYTALALCGLYHLTHGGGVALRLLWPQAPRPPRALRRLWLGIGVVAIVAAVASFATRAVARDRLRRSWTGSPDRPSADELRAYSPQRRLLTS